jgi:hypothetical protein
LPAIDPSTPVDPSIFGKKVVSSLSWCSWIQSHQNCVCLIKSATSVAEKT